MRTAVPPLNNKHLWRGSELSTRETLPLTLPITSLV